MSKLCLVVATFGAALAVVAATGPASAQVPDERGSPAERAALAEALFSKAKALMAERRFDEACPMLAESQRIDPGGGTQLTLALCHERQGKTATAWTELKDALALAQKDGEGDREAVAREHLAALEPKLSRLTVRVAATSPSLSVRLDGLVLERPAWGIGAPVDPGPHRVEASAPGKRSWAIDLRVEPGDSAAVIEVPALADEIAPASPRPPPVVPAPAGVSRPRTLLGATLLGVGAIGLGVGAGYGILAITKQSAADDRCPTTSCTDGPALRDNQTARSAAVVADVAVPLGLVAAAAGVVVLVTAPRSPRASIRLGPASASFVAAF